METCILSQEQNGLGTFQPINTVPQEYIPPNPCTGFPLTILGISLPFWCSALAAFCSLSTATAAWPQILVT